jgi:hypothetical protein
MAVVNVATSSSTSVSSVPAPPPGFRNILESDWTPGDDPAVNDIWDGQIPAGFNPPEPPPVEEIPSDLAAVNDRLTLLQAEIDRIKLGVEAIAG